MSNLKVCKLFNLWMKFWCMLYLWMNRYLPRNWGILNKWTGGGSGCVYARNNTEMSAGLSAPRDSIAARAVRALRHDSPAVNASVIGVTSCPLQIITRIFSIDSLGGHSKVTSNSQSCIACNSDDRLQGMTKVFWVRWFHLGTKDSLDWLSYHEPF